MIVTKLESSRVFYRCLTPKWSNLPLSGAGAAQNGGRFNRPGVEALYPTGRSAAEQAAARTRSSSSAVGRAAACGQPALIYCARTHPPILRPRSAEAGRDEVMRPCRMWHPAGPRVYSVALLRSRLLHRAQVSAPRLAATRLDVGQRCHIDAAGRSAPTRPSRRCWVDAVESSAEKGTLPRAVLRAPGCPGR